MNQNHVLRYGSSAGVPAITGFSSPEGGICSILSAFREPTQSKEVCSYSESRIRNKKHVNTGRCPCSLSQQHRERKSVVGLQREKQMLFLAADATGLPGLQQWNLNSDLLGWGNNDQQLWETLPAQGRSIMVL